MQRLSRVVYRSSCSGSADLFLNRHAAAQPRHLVKDGCSATTDVPGEGCLLGAGGAELTAGRRVVLVGFVQNIRTDTCHAPHTADVNEQVRLVGRIVWAIFSSHRP